MSNVKIVSKIQAFFTITKILALLIIIFFGFYNFAIRPTTTKEIVNEWFFESEVNFNGLAMAFYNGLFSFSGWNCLNFLTEEMKHPEK